LEINNINLRIKNTFDPEHPGTLITKDYICEHKRVEVITGTEKVMIIDIYDPSMVRHTRQRFGDHAVVFITTTSATILKPPMPQQSQ